MFFFLLTKLDISDQGPFFESFQNALFFKIKQLRLNLIDPSSS